MKTNHKVIAWWSGGLTSAVACRLALEKYEDVTLAYIHINSHSKDTLRFKEDCEKWYGQKIETYQSAKAKNQFEVFRKQKYINGPTGAPCTKILKKDVRDKIEKQLEWEYQVFGFEFEKFEINRAIRFQEQYPYTNPLFPLIDSKLNKNECAGLISMAGIRLPDMYLKGYSNNNCIGCVKGGIGYWNKIRVDYPEVFKEMSIIERELGATCLKDESGKIYLDELDPKRGDKADMVFSECGIFCQVEFAHIIDPRVQKVINGEASVYLNEDTK